MGRADYLALGDYNAVCFTCGFKFKASMLKKNWQGFWECPSCWNPRQPQDFVRAIPDNQTPPWTQPQPAAVYGFSDYLITESSDTLSGPLIYVTTESLYPLTTE